MEKHAIGVGTCWIGCDKYPATSYRQFIELTDLLGKFGSEGHFSWNAECETYLTYGNSVADTKLSVSNGKSCLAGPVNVCLQTSSVGARKWLAILFSACCENHCKDWRPYKVAAVVLRDPQKGETRDSRIILLNWRVWSWLRLNVGGRPHTCKSNGNRSLWSLRGELDADEWRTGE